MIYRKWLHFEFTQQKKIADKIIDRERNEIGTAGPIIPVSLLVSSSMVALLPIISHQ
jgi:hypothetical protein